MKRAMRPVTRPRRFLVVALAVALAAGLLVAVLWWRAGRDSPPFSEPEALGAFRAQEGTAVPHGGPSPGVYTYASSGSEGGGVGPFSLSRRLPGTARLVVTTTDGGWDAELYYSRDHVEGATYVEGPDGIRITTRRTKVEFAGVGQDDRRAQQPPPLFLPPRPKVGDAWTERYRTGDLNVVNSGRIVREQTVQVAGTPVRTLVVVTHSTTDGPHPGTRDEMMWWAPSLGIPARWDVRMDIGGVFAFRAASSVVLRDTTPRR